MHIRILVLFVLALLLFVTPSWAQSNCGEEESPCSITQSFSPGVTTGIYDFTGSNDGYLVVQFDTVLTSFTLTVTLDFTTNSALLLDPTEFPANTVCVQYQSQGLNNCVQYDISATASSPNGLPVRNVDYKGLITVTLSYFTAEGFMVQTPAFGHAPGDTLPTTFTVNILVAYSDDTICPNSCDPTMVGKIPTPSSLIGLAEKLTSSNTGCPLTLTTTNVASGQKPQVEVTLNEVSGSDCTVKGLRDKTASLSVSAEDSSGHFAGLPALNNVEGNKFHWDAKNGLNEYDISIDGLADGTYAVTVISSQISPQKAAFCISGGVATIGAC
jgi:hypothetical protein